MSTLIVDTQYGKVEGFQQGSVSVWKGIPFAKAPEGRLRFARPHPPESWSGVRDAKEFGPACVQVTNPLNPKESMSQSEDCLSLNVWSPAADNKKRPVMVWIHGGSFVFGSGQTPWYDGTSFAACGEVVVVTINYRLGPLGFMYFGDELGEEYATSGNCGILDQVAALRWVQENIAQFGGDPHRVTIFGESAGSMSVGALLIMPEARGLFQQAIMQSGLPVSVRTPAQAKDTTDHFLSVLGLGWKDLHKLFEMPAEKLVEASTQLPEGTNLRWRPVQDGVSIADSFTRALEAGAGQGIPMIVGCNLNEVALWIGRDGRWRDADDATRLNLFTKSWGEVPDELMAFYLDGKTGDQLVDAFIQLGSYKAFGAGIQKLAHRQVGQGPVYVYRFDWSSPVANGRLKACHALEIPFVFNTLDLPSSQVFTGDGADRQIVANQLHRAWIAFAHTGNPNTADLPVWPEYNLDTRPTMLFNVESRVQNDPYGEERIVWERLIGS